MIECDIAHRRTVAALCRLYKLIRNPMHPLYIWCSTASAGFTRRFGRTHRYTYAPPRCRTSQYCRTFIPLSAPLWNILRTLYSMVWDSRVSRAGPMLFYWSYFDVVITKKIKSFIFNSRYYDTVKLQSHLLIT